MATLHATTRASRTRTLLEFVKIEHTLFALPFVLAGMVMGFVQLGMAEGITLSAVGTFVLVLLAATGARTLGMTLNRIIDRAIDARNPRTATRALVTGEMSMRTAGILAAVSALVLLVAAALLNPLCLALAPVLALLFLAYPYAKRVTWACHLVLGLAFLCAPAGGYLAVTGSFEGWLAPFFLGLAAMAWVAGFDIIYALLDVQFDRAHDIQSVPARFGEATAQRMAAGLHLLTVVFLALFAWTARLDWPMYLAVIGIGALLAYEHAVVDHQDTVSINKAFFNVNAVVGWVALAGLLAALFL